LEGTRFLIYTSLIQPGGQFQKNVISVLQPGKSSSDFPADNFFPATDADIGFVDLANDDYTLASGSSFRNAALNGTDIGADVNAVLTATSGVDVGQ